MVSKSNKYREKNMRNDIVLIKSMISEADEKRLKKYLLDVIGKVNKINIKYQTSRPAIIIDYMNDSTRQVTPLSNFIKANESLRKNN